MREIKCRGFSLLGKKWVYGSYFKSDHSSSGHCILNESGLGHHEVAPKSVGQYTGLKDKNGVEIYEGDICKCNYFNGSKAKQHNEVVEFKNGQFKLTWTINKSFKSFRSRSCFHGHPDAFEIIGNIYENPELINQ